MVDLCTTVYNVYAWQEPSNVLLPDVSTNTDYSNGVSQTYNIIKNCNTLGYKSHLVENVIKEKYNHNGTILSGFIGTKIQMYQYYENMNIIRSSLISLGYNPKNVTDRVWYWTSSQASSDKAVFNRAGYWVNFGKTATGVGIPLFSAT